MKYTWLVIAVWALWGTSSKAREWVLSGESFSSNDFISEVKAQGCEPLTWRSQTRTQYQLTADCPTSPVSSMFLASPSQRPWDFNDRERNRWEKLGLVSGPLIIMGYGLLAWDWGKQSFRFRDEKFFQKNTYAGGADKLAHTYAHFLIHEMYYSYFSALGFTSNEANLRATIAASAIGTFIEIGDGMSHYGFAYSDLVADLVGVGLSALFYGIPEVNTLLGFQVQYFHLGSFIDDYNYQKYVLNIKAGGIPKLRDMPVVKYLNLDLGYFTRGYGGDDPKNRENDPNKQFRHLYTGLSINLSKLIEDPNPRSTWRHNLAQFFNVYQTPLNAIEVIGRDIH